MKPGDHPNFFQLPAPEGRSRESTIRLDCDGRFWHDERPVEHAGLKNALHSWIGRHPDDGRYILNNGYDWTYFTVDDTPFIVRAIRIEPERIVLLLNDGTEHDWKPEATRISPDGVLCAVVRKDARAEGWYEAKFSRHAQASLAPALVDAEPAAVVIGGRVHGIGAKKTRVG